MCTHAVIHYSVDGTSESDASCFKCSNRKLDTEDQNDTNFLTGDSVFNSSCIIVYTHKH